MDYKVSGALSLVGLGSLTFAISSHVKMRREKREAKNMRIKMILTDTPDEIELKR